LGFGNIIGHKNTSFFSYNMSIMVKGSLFGGNYCNKRAIEGSEEKGARLFFSKTEKSSLANSQHCPRVLPEPFPNS